MIDEIELNKKINETINLSRANSKLEKCLCCGKKSDGFCNSHSIPRFVLKNISKNGLLLTSNQFFEMPYINVESGLNNSGIFKRICRNCDNSVFRDYENEKNILRKPTKKVMTQIDLKNTLRMYDKRLTEISLYNILEKEYGSNIFSIQMGNINHLDLNEIELEFNRDMDILNNNSTDSFDLIYWKVLDYNTPVAFQGHIALNGDMEGNLINDIYNFDKRYKIENVNLCIFPLSNGKTVIYLFISKKYKKYKKFIIQFKKLSELNKQKLLSFIICNYTEDYFISKEVNKELLENERIKEVAKNTANIFAFDEETFNNAKKVKIKELTMYKTFPNILGKEYAINQNEL